MEETFASYTTNYHDRIREWKQQTGGKVIGYFCCSIPEEMIFAAGVLPVRIVGTSLPLEHANLHVSPNTCPFGRSCLEAGMRGQYDYLDAVVVPTSCDMMSAMDYFWERHVPNPHRRDLVRGVDLNQYVYRLHYPEKVTGKESLLYYVGVLREFRQGLERSLNRPISDDDLRRAIAVYEDYGAQMDRMHALRRKQPPVLSGYEAWQIGFAGSMMPKDKHAALLKDYLDRLEQQGSQAEEGIRLLLSSGPLDPIDAGVIRVIEEAGGQVVVDDTCFGSRSTAGGVPVEAASSPLEAIARRSLGVSCPRSTNSDRIPMPRWDFMKKLVDGCAIEGAIFYSMKFCDARLADVPFLSGRLRQEFKVPSLHVEGDHTASGVEQLRERIEAFIEMIEER